MSCLLACPRRAVHPGPAPARWVYLHSLCINGSIMYSDSGCKTACLLAIAALQGEGRFFASLSLLSTKYSGTSNNC